MRVAIAAKLVLLRVFFFLFWNVCLSQQKTGWALLLVYTPRGALEVQRTWRGKQARRRVCCFCLLQPQVRAPSSHVTSSHTCHIITHLSHHKSIKYSIELRATLKGVWVLLYKCVGLWPTTNNKQPGRRHTMILGIGLFSFIIGLFCFFYRSLLLLNTMILGILNMHLCLFMSLHYSYSIWLVTEFA